MCQLHMLTDSDVTLTERCETAGIYYEHRREKIVRLQQTHRLEIGYNVTKHTEYFVSLEASEK